MHALKTFSQLVTFEPKSDEYKVYHTPIMIADTPRMAYRGVLVDVARHFMPIKFLEKVIDVMSAAKLNVLHLHLSDQESYPLESKTFPDLWDSAFSATERYTVREMRQLVRYAHMRGVAVLPEIDTPGHSKSMCQGVPSTPDTQDSQGKATSAGICMATFYGATSFNQTLSGAWATSTANKTRMFKKCPGSIR